MKYLRQLAILFFLCMAGDVLSVLTGKHLPGNVLGMILLFLLLLSRKLSVNQIAETTDFFLKNMAFFFLPACLGILEIYHQIAPVLWPLLLICLITTFLTALSAAYTVKFVLLLQNRYRRCRKQVSS